MTTDPTQPTSTPRSRREFLELAGKSAAASALVTANPAFAHGGADSTIKLALVGCGGRGGGAVGDAVHTTGGPVKLHAMADLFEHRLSACHNAITNAYPDKIDVPPERRFLGFDAYKRAIDTLSPGDVVLLTTHAAFRPLHFEYAVKKGVNVFMEKSFATDAPGVRRLLKVAGASERKGLKVGVGFMWRHSQARQEVIQRIHDGEIGDLHTLRIYRVHGPVHCPPRPKGANELVFQIQHPNSFTWVSSGFFIDWHCHNVDVACWAKDAWPVSAQGFGSRTYEAAGNQFDHYSVEYTFPDGAKLFAFSRHMNNCWNTYSDYAHGSKGSAILMESLAQPRTRIYAGQDMTREPKWAFGKNDPSPYRAEWQVLLDAIRNDTPHNEARRAGEADIAALMGRIATHTGQYVTWDQVMSSEYQFVEDIDNMSFETEAPIHDGPNGIYDAPLPGISEEL